MAALDDFEKLLDLQIPQALQVSPTGNRVVYSTSLFFDHKVKDHATSTIWIAGTNKEDSSRPLTSGLFNDKSPKWSPDESSIVFVSDRKDAGSSSALYQLNLNGGEPVPLTDVEHKKSIGRFEFSPNGKWIAFLAAAEKTAEKKQREEDKDDALVFGAEWEYDRLYLLHLQTRSIDTIVSGNFHVSNFTWNPNSSSIAFTQQHTPEIDASIKERVELKLVDVGNKTIKTVSACKSPPALSANEISMQWIKDCIYMTCYVTPGNEQSSAAVFSCSVGTGDWRKEIGGDTFCAPGLGVCGERAIAFAQNGLLDEIRDVSDAKVLFSKMCHIASFHSAADPHDSDKYTIALAYSTINKPVEVYTFTSDNATPTQVSSHSPASLEDIAVPIPVHCRSTDDAVDLDGLFLAPKRHCESDRPAEPLRTFVQPHGGPYYRLGSTFYPGYPFAQLLLRAGHAVFLPNYRGGASHGLRFAGPYQAGTVDYSDVIALTSHIVAEGLADKRNLIIGGWSQGGFLAYLSAVRNNPASHPGGWRFRAAVAGAGVSDWDMMSATSDIPLLEADMAGLAPWEAKDKSDVRSRAGSALWEFKKAADEGWVPPMLLLHGQEDARVPVTQAWAFQRACRARKIDCTMVTYPREGHGFDERRHLVDLHKRVVEFCDRHFE